MEDWDSYIRMLEEYNKPYERYVPLKIANSFLLKLFVLIFIGIL